LVFKSQENKIANTRNLGFLETTVHRVREKAENQGKTREKSKVAENQVFWWDFCAKKGLCSVEVCMHPLDILCINPATIKHLEYPQMILTLLANMFK
jgi:hypothetical protein